MIMKNKEYYYIVLYYITLLIYLVCTALTIVSPNCFTQVCLTRPEKWSCALFDRPLVAGCSTGHKPRPLHVNE